MVFMQSVSPLWRRRRRQAPDGGGPVARWAGDIAFSRALNLYYCASIFHNLRLVGLCHVFTIINTSRCIHISNNGIYLCTPRSSGGVRAPGVE